MLYKLIKIAIERDKIAKNIENKSIRKYDETEGKTLAKEIV